MPEPTVLRDPELIITFGGTPVDLSEWTKRVSPASEVESLDARTFAHPKRMLNGQVTDSLTVTALWAPELYAAMLPYIDQEGEMAFKPDSGDSEAIRATVSYATLPWGDFELGQVVEVSISLAVLSDITYS